MLESIGLNRSVLALSVARMADALGNSILIVIIPIYISKLPKTYFHLALPVLVGLLISAYGLINSLLQPFMGALSDKLNRRKLLIQIGLAIIGVSTILFIYAGNFLSLFLLRTFQGVGVALTIPASLSLMAAITEKKTRGGSMGIYSTFRMIGFSIGPVIGGFLQTRYGFNTAFVVGALFIALAMVMVQAWVRDVEEEESSETTTSVKSRFRIFDLSLLNPGILSASLSTFLMAAAFSMVVTLENEFNARLDITSFGFGIAFSMLMVGRLVTQIPLGHYSDKVGRKIVMLGGLLFMAPVTALLGEVTSLWQLIVLRILQGVAAGAVAAPAFAVGADLSKSGGTGRQMSVITMGFGLGIALGPLLAGVLDLISFEVPFFTLACLLVLGSWIVYQYMPETVTGQHVVFTKSSRRAVSKT